jgi:hypothetical protein
LFLSIVSFILTNSPKAAALHVATLIEELLAVKEQDGQGVNRREVRWQPPEEGWTKVNTDGAFYASIGQGAKAAVLRNY